MDKKPRILPNDLEAEQSLLGCLFISPDACIDIFPSIKASDFYSQAHQKIYQAMYDIYLKSVAVDYITVSNELEVKGELEEVGGLSYLTDLTNFVPSAANFKHYADIVRNASILRQIIEASQLTINEAFTVQDSAKVLSKAEELIFNISQTQHAKTLEHIRVGVNEAIDLMEKVSVDPNANMGVKVGFPILDRCTNGFKSGELIIIAARPGIGKTTLAVNFAINAALKHNKTIAMFDLEMSSLQIAQRFLCATGRVPMDMVKGGSKEATVWNTLLETKKLLENSNIYIDDTTNIKPSDILSKCRRLKARYGLDMVIIDYLQLMKTDTTNKEVSRQQEVSDLTRNIKLTARELGVPIILLSQLNRESEKRSDKTPQLSDLRESGSIEQDADIVMFISDQPVKDADNTEDDDDDDAVNYSLVIAKHRNGPRGTIPIKWKSEFTQFYEKGKDNQYTKNTTKMQKDVVLTPTENDDINDILSED